ncbi:MAG: SMI1/KNR4 family protein, partial [Mucilaginibacter sp.]
MENWIQNVIEKWSAEGVKLNPPATIIEIEKVESILNFKFPEDFKGFYLQVNGFHELGWQQHMFTFWQLEMIVDEFKGNTNNNFIGFCDFLLASHYIGYNRN